MKIDGAKSMKKILRFSVGLLVNVAILLVLIKAFSTAFSFTYDVFASTCKDSASTKIVAVEIKADSSIKEVCNTLDDAGVVKNKYALMVKIRIGKSAAKIKPGTYELSPSYTNDEIITVITGGTLEEE